MPSKFRNKKLIALLVLAVTFFAPLTVSAAKYSYLDAVDEFEETLELIDSAYLDSADLNYKELLDSALSAVFDKLDKYSEYMTMEEYKSFSSYAETTQAGIGISIVKSGSGYPIITKVYKDSPAQAAGLKTGDLIMAVGGVGVGDKKMLDVRDMIIGDAGTNVEITVKRDGKELKLTASRGSFKTPLAERLDIGQFIPGADGKKTALVEVTAFAHNETQPASDTAKQFAKIYDELKKEGVKNLIIDLRNNTGGDVAAVIEMSQLLVKEGILFSFRYNSGSDDVFRSHNTKLDFNVAVLVNESTASSAEVIASSIQESGSGIIVGCNTYGKGVGQIPVPASDGEHMIKLTVTEITTRNGNKLNGVGVKPDIFVPAAPWLYVDGDINENSIAADIAALNAALDYLGYKPAAVSGKYDLVLQAALKQFQKDKGLKVDGVCSAEVIGKLNDCIGDKERSDNTALKKAYESLNK